MKGDFKPSKKKELPSSDLAQQRLNFAAICGKLSGAVGQVLEAKRITTEIAARARAILDTPELIAYLTGAEAGAMNDLARDCENAAVILQNDYAPLVAVEQRIRALNRVESIPASGHSPEKPKKKSLAETAATQGKKK